MSETLKITVKTATSKEVISVPSSATIKELREAVHEKFQSPVAQLCLIFSGRILKDQDTVQSEGIKDGMTIHLVIKSNNQAQEQAAQHASSTTAPSTTPTTSSTSTSGSNLFGLGGLGMGGNQNQMMQQMMNNPDAMRAALDNPMVQSLTNNPELMRSIMMSNPEMQQLVERNPQMSHILNNPDLMRQTMEMMRNPAMMQEMMRNQDRAMSNIENIPGGFNALRQLYTDVQEPMMNAADEQMRRRFGLNDNNSGGGATENPQLGQENLTPLPNPWGGGAAPSTTSAGAGGGTNTTPANPFTLFTNAGGSTPSTTSSSVPGAAPAGLDGLMQSPAMQQMMQQMMSDPAALRSLLQINPTYANNPQLLDQVSNQLPQMMQRMQDPQFAQAMTNPRVQQAIQQIQQGVATLQTEAPEIMPMFGMPAGTAPAATTQPNTTTSSTPTTTASSTPAAATPNPQFNQMFNNLLAGMTGNAGGGVGGQSQLPPEERYATQLDQLNSMGFMDRQANIRVLQGVGGDVNAAIERLIGGS